MNLNTVRLLGKVDNALLEGKLDDAERVFQSLESDLPADELQNIKKSLYDSYGIKPQIVLELGQPP